MPHFIPTGARSLMVALALGLAGGAAAQQPASQFRQGDCDYQVVTSQVMGPGQPGSTQEQLIGCWAFAGGRSWFMDRRQGATRDQQTGNFFAYDAAGNLLIMTTAGWQFANQHSIGRQVFDEIVGANSAIIVGPGTNPAGPSRSVIVGGMTGQALRMSEDLGPPTQSPALGPAVMATLRLDPYVLQQLVNISAGMPRQPLSAVSAQP